MKTSILITTALALLLVVPVLTAQPADLKVTEVEVSLKSLMDKGEPDMTKAYVRNHIRIRPGDKFRPGMTNPDVHALMKTGRFHDVRVEASLENGKVTLKFIVWVYPKVATVDFLLKRPDGAELTALSLQIKEKDLRKKITLRKGVLYSDTQRKTDEKALRDHYEDKGYYPVKVTSIGYGKLGKTPGEVIYYITEGEQFQIENMIFEGNEGDLDFAHLGGGGSRLGEELRRKQQQGQGEGFQNVSFHAAHLRR